MVRCGLFFHGAVVGATVCSGGDAGVAPPARCVACAVYLASELKRRGSGASGPADGTAAAHEGEIRVISVVSSMPAALPGPY
jgi:hypothetical protein